MYSIYTEQQKYSQSNKPIAITIPVNLRKVFPSKTLRNFFVAPNVSSCIGNDTDFDELVADITLKLKTITEKKSLQTLLTDNVSIEKRIYSRFVPLSIKKALIKIGSDIIGESRNTMTISNLGNVSVPSGFLQNIKLMEMNLYPTPKTCMNCAVCSLGDNLAISFSRSVMESDIIRRFFKSLAESGLSIEICSNDWGMEYE
jgi:NRPS condensation-like uncharacterized protein